MSVASMTKSEFSASLKKMNNDLGIRTCLIQHATSTCSKFVAKVEMYTARVQLYSGAKLREAQTQLARAQDRLEYFNIILARHVSEGEREMADIRRMEEQYALMSAPVVLEQSSDVKEPVVSAILTVRLMSGDLKLVEIDMARPVASFADVFAQTHGYNVAVTSRMVFMIQSTVEEKEDNVFWSPEERHEGKTFAEMFADYNVEDLPIIHLIIRPMVEDQEMGAKVELIRKLLKEQSLNDNYEDETLFAMYGTWYLTYQLPAKPNRYLTMKAFVAQNTDVFWPMSEEDKVLQKEREDVRQFRRWVRNVAQGLQNRIRYGRVTDQTRVVAFELLEGMIAQNDVNAMTQQMNHFMRYIHPLEMAHMGVPSEAMCRCEEHNCFAGKLTQWIARAGLVTLPENTDIVWRI